MSQKQYIVVGIPSASGLIDYRTVSSLIALQLTENTRLVFVPRIMIDTARNQIVTSALQDPNCTHVLFIDDDMLFPTDTLLKLLSHDKDIVGVQAFKRREKYEPCVYIKKEDKFYPALIREFSEVDAIGTGVLLVKIGVFKKLKFPWFYTGYDPDGTHWSVDFNFCKDATKEGYKIFCDPDMSIGHIGDSKVIGIQDFAAKMEHNNTKLTSVKRSETSEKQQTDSVDSNLTK
jgi:GT2 family glycosyltransferase